MPPIVRPFPMVTIRKFEGAVHDAGPDRGRRVGRGAGRVPASQIEAGKTLLISGGTDSCKTTLLNAPTDYISDAERSVTIEDVREL